MATRNQTPEQKARDNIDAMLEQAGWKVQPGKKIDFNAGPGKTYTAITSIYRLLKHADAKRILFLVDTKNPKHVARRRYERHCDF